MAKKISDYMGIIQYNYHTAPSTWGECKVDGCKESARGSGTCKYCAEKGLAKLVGDDKAKEFHIAVKNLHKISCELLLV